MYTTAPMGMVQAVSPPAQPPAAYMPQAPAAARLTPVAVMGMLPAANPQAQTKSPTPQQPNLRAAAQIQSSAEGRTPENYMFEVDLEAPPTPPPTPTESRDAAAQRLLGGRDTATAAQFMAQEELADSADLPDTLDISDMMQRAAAKRAARGEAAPTPSGAQQTLARMGQTTILPPTLPSLARPNPVAVMPSNAYIETTTNTIVRRDTPGTVMNRGQNAYRQAMQRLGEVMERVEPIAEFSREEFAAV